MTEEHSKMCRFSHIRPLWEVVRVSILLGAISSGFIPNNPAAMNGGIANYPGPPLSLSSGPKKITKENQPAVNKWEFAPQGLHLNVKHLQGLALEEGLESLL